LLGGRPTVLFHPSKSRAKEPQMLLVYKPNDGDRQEFKFDPPKLISVEAEAIEDVGGESWESYEEFIRKFFRGNRKSFRALLWVMLCRTKPELEFDAVSVTIEELTVELEEEDRRRAFPEDYPDQPEPVPEPEGKDEPADESTDSP